MFKKRSVRITAIVLAVVLLLSVVASAALNYDLNGDGKTNVWDLQLALNDGASKEDQDAALKEALGAGDELHKNAEGQWEIYTSLGLYNMAKHAKAGDTFVLMHDIDMEGALWTPVENFNGKFIGSEKFTVSNMKITQAVDGSMGFFASVAEGGSVYRLNLAGMNVIAAKDATTIGLVAGTCAGKIDSCTAIGFLTDERTAIPENFVVGGLVGRLADSGEVAVHVENMLPALGQESEIPNISAKIGIRTNDIETYKKYIAIVGDKGNGTVDPMAYLEDLTGAMHDPNAIAWVENVDGFTYPRNLTELLSMIRSDGNTVVTLQADLYNDAAINIPYTSTWDLNGYTVRTNPTKGNCMNFNAVGSENKITTVKNGTIYHYEMGIRVDYGAVVASNLVMYGKNAPNVGIYDPSPEYNAIHRIEDCELYNNRWGVFAYNRAESDFTNVNITIERSKLVTTFSSGSALFVKRSGSSGGTVTLGNAVDLYTYGTAITSGNTVAGVDPVLLDKTADLTIDGVTYKGLNHWTTDESLLSTAVIAEVTNGTDTVQVTSTRAIMDAISATGNTKVKLLQDVTCTALFKLPYSCTLDLNNYSITNATSNAVYIAGVGTENTVTYIKNGTINHGVLGVRVDAGSIDLSNVRINGVAGCGASVAFYDPTPAYRANNKIDDCYFYNPNYNCIRWNAANVDFSGTGVRISNSTLIATKNYAFGMSTDRMSGVQELGENLEIYSNKTILSNGSLPRYSGMIANSTDETTVTVDGAQITGLHHWSTAHKKDTVNVLLLGNSLSTTIPEELYKIAENDGYELTVTDLYHAGAYGWQHKDWIERNAEEYEYRVYNDMGFWLHGDIKTVSGAADYMDWDHVSYQDFITASYGKTYDQAVEKYGPYVEWVVDYLKKEIPNAKFYFYEHWSWQVGHSTVPDTATQTKLFEVIRDSSHYFSEQCGTTLIPCGEAWQLARADSRIGDTLCKPEDNLHDNGPTGGQYLNGCVFYEVMFQKTCVGDTWRASNGPSEEIHQAMQQYAHQAVAAVHGDDYAK